MPGPHHGRESEIFTTHSARLFCLLRALAHAPGVGQGCARTESGGETGARPHRIHCSSRRVAPSLPATSRLGQKRARILARLEFPSRCLRQLHFPDGTNLLDLLDLLDEAGIHWCRAAEPRTQLNGSPGGIERKAAMLAVTAKSSRRSDFR